MRRVNDAAYEYFCPNCKSKFELIRSLGSAGEDASCPTCHTTSRRVFSTCASFSRGGDGASYPFSGSGGSCSTCGGGTCSTCG